MRYLTPGVPRSTVITSSAARWVCSSELPGGISTVMSKRLWSMEGIISCSMPPASRTVA